jgi:hypothetical protein
MSKVEELWVKKEVMDKVNQFNSILNQEPSKEWIRTLPGTTIKYLPIERLEWLMTSIFGQFKYEVKSVLVVDNSISVVVRVHYYNPVLDVWEWADGCGAAPLLASEGDMAVALALPAAKTFAVKDAVEPLGKMFGKDLNRADQIVYDNLSKGKKDKTDVTRKVIAALQKYQGKDKEQVKADVMKAVKDGWPQEAIDSLSKKLSVHPSIK